MNVSSHRGLCLLALDNENEKRARITLVREISNLNRTGRKFALGSSIEQPIAYAECMITIFPHSSQSS